MGNKIRTNDAIIPFEIPQCNIRFNILQYADDTMFLLKDDSFLKETIKELTLFGKVAGPKLNKDKTTMMWIGDNSKRWNLTQHI